MLRAVAISIVSLLIAVSVPAATRADEIDDLLESLSSADRGVREKAASELALLGPEVLKPLLRTAVGEDHRAAAGARVALELLVHQSARPGRERERETVAAALLAEISGSWPIEERKRLLWLLSFVGGDSSVPALSGLLADRDLGEMALFALSRIPGDDSCAALEKALAAAPAERCQGLLHAVAERGRPASAARVAPFLTHDDSVVRIAAVEALGRIPEPGSAETLWKIVRGGEGPEPRRAAAASLDLADTLLAAGFRNEAADIFARFCLDGQDVHQRCAGLTGLSRVKGAEMIPMLASFIQLDIPELSGTAVDILSRMEGAAVEAVLADLVSTAAGDTGIHLIYAVNRRSGTRAWSLLQKGLKSPDSGVRIAVLGLLGDSGKAEALDAVLPLTKDAGSDTRAAAVRACIRIGEGVAARDRKKAFEIIRGALEAAEADGEKTAALRSLGALGDEAAVPVLERYLEEKSHAVSQAALRAMAPLARQIARSKEGRRQAVGLLRTVVGKADDPGVVQDAALILRDLGVDVDVPVRKGYVKHFSLLGPLPDRSELIGNDPVPVDGPIDLRKKVTHKGREYAWIPHQLLHIRGKLDLIAVVADQDNVGVYAYAEVKSENECEACFKIGSDDDVFCWLNNELVHSFQGGRGWSADQDSVDVHLRSGTNRILLKVLNGGGDWAVSLRITDRDGTPLDVKQRRP